MDDRRRLVLAALLACVATLAACSSTGPFVWVQDLPKSPPPQQSIIIAAGDVLDVHVYNNTEATQRARVRDDGMITLSIIGDVVAAGHTPSNLARDITARLKVMLTNPIVTVSVEERRPVNISVIGEVQHPGVFTLSGPTGVLQALALAGGLTEFADKDAIYVLRKTPSMRVRFTYDALMHNNSSAQAFTLASGDIVTAE